MDTSIPQGIPGFYPGKMSDSKEINHLLSMLMLNVAYSQNKLFLTAQQVLNTLCSQMNKEENFGSAVNYFRSNSEGHMGGTL